MKKIIITGYTDNFRYGSDILIENKKKYSERHGWDFECKTDNDFDKTKPASFSKINFIVSALDKYDLVFWNDMDSIFTNLPVDISNSLNDEYIGVLEQWNNYFCCGNMLIRSNEFTTSFFKSFYTMESWKNNRHPWEQRCFNELIALHKFIHLRRFKINEFGSFYKEGWNCIRPWEKGDFMIHLSSNDIHGNSISWEQRVNVFLAKYKDQIIV